MAARAGTAPAMVLPVQRRRWCSAGHPLHLRRGAGQPGGGWEDGEDSSLMPVEIQQWLQPVGWEGILHGSRRRGPAGVAQFQREEKSLVCRGGLAPLSSTAPLATVTPQPALAPQPSAPPNLLTAASRAEPCCAALPHPAAVPRWLRRHCQARHRFSRPHPSRPSPGLCAHG